MATIRACYTAPVREPPPRMRKGRPSGRSASSRRLPTLRWKNQPREVSFRSYATRGRPTALPLSPGASKCNYYCTRQLPLLTPFVAMGTPRPNEPENLSTCENQVTSLAHLALRSNRLCLGTDFGSHLRGVYISTSTQSRPPPVCGVVSSHMASSLNEAFGATICHSHKPIRRLAMALTSIAIAMYLM